MAARGACAAAGDAGDWISPYASPEPFVFEFCVAFRLGLSKSGFVEGRTSQSNFAGRRVITNDCQHWRPISLPPSRSDRSRGGAVPGACGKSGDLDNSDCVRHRRRSGQAWPRRQPQSAGWQRDGREPSSLNLRPKRLDLLRELVPQPRLLRYFSTPTIPAAEAMLKTPQAAAHAISGSNSIILTARKEGDFDSAFATLLANSAPVRFWSVFDPFFIRSAAIKSSRLAAHHAIPAIY